MPDVSGLDEQIAARPGAGATVWLTGLPSAGKSTIAGAAAKELESRGHRVEVLDGDECRAFLCRDLGFSREDRDTNVRRIGYVAELLASNGVLVLVPVIAPYADSRAAVRRSHEQQGTSFVEVYVQTAVDCCARRDVKGLYARQRAGALTGLTGVDDPYEPPTAPDLRIDTEGCDVGQSADALLETLENLGIVRS